MKNTSVALSFVPEEGNETLKGFWGRKVIRVKMCQDQYYKLYLEETAVHHSCPHCCAWMIFCKDWFSCSAKSVKSAYPSISAACNHPTDSESLDCACKLTVSQYPITMVTWGIHLTCNADLSTFCSPHWIFFKFVILLDKFMFHLCLCFRCVETRMICVWFVIPTNVL